MQLHAYGETENIEDSFAGFSRNYIWFRHLPESKFYINLENLEIVQTHTLFAGDKADPKRNHAVKNKTQKSNNMHELSKYSSFKQNVFQ